MNWHESDGTRFGYLEHPWRDCGTFCRNFGGDFAIDMYGVPSSLDLTPFHGSSMDQIALGQYIVQFRFSGDPPREIGVEGRWELRSPSGAVVDSSQDNVTRDVYRVHALLGRTVLTSEVRPPKSIVLHFDSGHALEIFDDDSRYESFSIQPGDIFV